MQHPRLSPCRRLGLVVLLLLAPFSTAPADAATDHASAASVYGDSSSPSGYTTMPDRPGIALFTASTLEEGEQIWRTDGSAEGTTSLHACADSCGGTRFLGGAGGVMYFVTVTGGSYRFGRTDGTVAGTWFMPSGLGGELLDYSFPLQLHSVALDGLVFTSYNSLGGNSLWIWDGTAAPARRLSGLSSSGRGGVTSLVELAGRVHLLVLDLVGERWELWTSDGTAAGTVQSAVLPLGFSYRLSHLRAQGSRAVFTAALGFCDVAIWVVDPTGSAAEVARISDQPRCRNFSPVEVQAIGARFFVPIFDADHDREMWATDGTVAGTVRLTDLQPERSLPYRGSDLYFEPLVPFGDRVLFQTIPADGQGEMWISDGTAAGTAPAAALCPQGDCAGVGALVSHRGTAYLAVSRTPGGQAELWSSDGTAGGTRYLGDLPPLLTTPQVSGNSMFVLGGDPVLGQEIWYHRIGGPGLVRITDFEEPEALGGTPSVAFVGERLLFTTADPFHGSEPWISDGTAAGTRMLADLADRGTATEPPVAPRNVQTTAWGESIHLSWDWPGAQEESGQVTVEMRSPGRDWEEVLVTDATVPSASFDRLPSGTPHTFRVRVTTAGGTSPYSETASATTGPAPLVGSPCVPTEEVLCFGDGRFGVQVHWWNQRQAGPVADVGRGKRADAGEPGRTGYFWFFRPDNVELIVKMLDGGSVNGYYWTFYGALTDVEYWITVRDHWNPDLTRTYHNPHGEICGVGDTTSFFSTSRGEAPSTAEGAFALEPLLRSEAGAGTACVEDATTLCLLDGRFRVQVEWRNQRNGEAGAGGAVPYANRTGFFWFFRPDNVELVVKVLDGTPVNGKVWVFYGALTDVGFTLTVTDTATGDDIRQYVNPPGNLCGDADTAAF